MALDMHGKAVVILGASSGIGRAIASEIARQGAKVALLARRTDQLAQLRETIRGAGGTAIAIYCDIADKACTEHSIAEAESSLGAIDLLIITSGIYIQGDIKDLSIDSIRQAMEVNFFGVVNAIHMVLPKMLTAHSGGIAVVSSMDGVKAFPGDGAYCASKFALNGFLESLRQEIRGSGVHIMTVLPGRVDTPMIEHIKVPAISKKIAPEQVARTVIAGLRRKRTEVIVPKLSSLALIYADTLSPALGDYIVRRLKLRGEAIK